MIAAVWNPAKTERDELEAALRAADHEGPVDWRATSESDPGQQATAEALRGEPDLLLVAGGDGTVRAAIEVLAGTSVPLGIVPRGTGNLLARNLGIPLDAAGACRIALGDGARRIDVGWAEVQGRRHAFAVIAGFGIDSRMIVETDDDLKSSAGWLAYLAALGRSLSSADVVGVALAVDGEPATSIEAHTVLVGNCGTVQGGLTLLPDAVPDDGLLDLMALSAETVPGWLETLKTAVWDNGVLRWLQDDRDAVAGANTSHLRGSRFALTMDKPVTFEVDGDELGDLSAVTFEIQPVVVTVRV